MIFQYDHNQLIEFEIGDLTSYMNPKVEVEISDGQRRIQKECRIINLNQGLCQFELSSSDLLTIGIYKYQATILTEDRNIHLFHTFEFEVMKHHHSLTELSDVDAATKENGDVLTYDSSTERFILKASTTGATHLRELSDVDVSTVTEGEFLKYEGGIWKNSKLPFNGSLDSVYYEEWVEGEVLEIIDTTPPFDVTNLEAVDVKDTFLTLTWIESVSSDIKQYNIYNGSTLLGTVSEPIFKVSGLAPKTTYLFYLKSVDDSNNESAGAIVSATTLPSKYYLSMDGLTSSLLFPVMTYDSIKMNVRFLDSYVQPKGGSGLFYSSDYNQHYLTMNGAKGSETIGLFRGTAFTPPNDLPKNSVETVTLKLSAPITKATGLLTKYDSISQVKGDLFHTITFYLGESIVALYDLTTGTVMDQSGNGYDAHLNNGKWVTIPYS